MTKIIKINQIVKPTYPVYIFLINLFAAVEKNGLIEPIILNDDYEILHTSAH